MCKAEAQQMAMMVKVDKLECLMSMGIITMAALVVMVALEVAALELVLVETADGVALAVILVRVI